MLGKRWRLGFGMAAAMLLGAGCATSSHDTATKAKTTTGTAPAATTAGGVAPTDPARVEVIPWAPDRTYRRMGEITITPAPSSSPKQIDASLREAAGSLGAHAVFVIWDPKHRLQVVQVDPLATERELKYPPDAIVAVAIRYE
ncbi:MAG: hypothetical protein U1G08_09625 [Verrucomicrobiota bacterium]